MAAGTEVVGCNSPGSTWLQKSSINLKVKSVVGRWFFRLITGRYDNLQGLGEKKLTMIRHRWSHPGMCGRETNGEKSWRENKEERGKERKMGKGSQVRKQLM